MLGHFLERLRLGRRSIVCPAGLPQVIAGPDKDAKRTLAGCGGPLFPSCLKPRATDGTQNVDEAIWRHGDYKVGVKKRATFRGDALTHAFATGGPLIADWQMRLQVG